MLRPSRTTTRGSTPTRVSCTDETPAEAARDADIVVSVVVNAAQTEAILFGKDGAAETLAKDAVFISSATMDPEIARRLAKQLEATGRHYLDAPVHALVDVLKADARDRDMRSEPEEHDDAEREEQLLAQVGRLKRPGERGEHGASCAPRDQLRER